MPFIAAYPQTPRNVAYIKRWGVLIKYMVPMMSTYVADIIIICIVRNDQQINKRIFPKTFPQASWITSNKQFSSCSLIILTSKYIGILANIAVTMIIIQELFSPCLNSREGTSSVNFVEDNAKAIAIYSRIPKLGFTLFMNIPRFFRNIFWFHITWSKYLMFK